MFALKWIEKFASIRAENETRTRDPNLGKVVLYQLSYFRIISLLCLKKHPVVVS